MLTANDGVFVGGWSPGGKRLHYLRHNGPEHILAFAPTRSGKGVGLVIPTLLAWSESAIVYDIKGENWAKTAGFRAQAGHLCFKFSPVEPQATSRFNPLREVRLFTPRDVSDAQNIASMIVRTGEDSPQERYWQEASTSITTGMSRSSYVASCVSSCTSTVCTISTAVTSNIDLRDWGRYLGDATVAAAILDRLAMHAIRIDIDGPSYRQHVATERAGRRPATRADATDNTRS